MPVLSFVASLRWRRGTPRQTLSALGGGPARFQLRRSSGHGVRLTRPQNLAGIWLYPGVNVSPGGRVRGGNAAAPREGVVVGVEEGSGRGLMGSIDYAPDDLGVGGSSLAPPGQICRGRAHIRPSDCRIWSFRYNLGSNVNRVALARRRQIEEELLFVGETAHELHWGNASQDAEGGSGRCGW